MPGITGQLAGIIPPVCTPLTEDYEIDTASLERLVGFHLDAGVHGLFVLGSTSETVLLSDRQRVTLIETVVQAAKGRVPVLAGVIDTSTAASLDHAHAAKEAGVDGLVLTAPFYVTPSQGEIIEHFRIIHGEIGLPILAYDIPSAVRTKIERETVLALAEEGLIVGLKDSSGDEGNFRHLLIAAKRLPGLALFTGSELLVDHALLAGAAGSVPGLGNVDPAAFVRLFDAVQAGDLATARQEQERLAELFTIIYAGTHGRMGFTASALGSFKTALMLRGIIATNVPGRPLTRFNDEEVARVRDILVRTGLL